MLRRWFVGIWLNVTFTALRARITFRVDNRGGLVPFHHQFLIAQLIRGLVISDKNGEFQSFEHYSFSGLKGQTKVNRNGLHYTSSRVTLVITSISQEFLKYLIDLLFKQDSLRIGDLILSPETTDQEVGVELSRSTKYICISPLILLEPSFNDDVGKRFISPDSADFSDLLFESTVARMSNLGIATNDIEDMQKFQLIPDTDYINRMSQSRKKYSRIYSVYDQDVQYEARGYTFPFELFAAPEVQDFIFTCGLGHYCHKGHGMLDIAHENPVKRTEPRTTRSLISA